MTNTNTKLYLEESYFTIPIFDCYSTKRKQIYIRNKKYLDILLSSIKKIKEEDLKQQTPNDFFHNMEQNLFLKENEDISCKVYISNLIEDNEDGRFFYKNKGLNKVLEDIEHEVININHVKMRVHNFHIVPHYTITVLNEINEIVLESEIFIEKDLE